jgi:prepilin-type N-terminal cleavage/methylation domain-containing protein/prepilin-type processing-associated H-X9-DG protein
MKRKTGFTLIELLVVIAIIAILAAILMPVFTAAKAQAKMSACQSNMKQLGTAMRAYADDWNGYLAMSHMGKEWQNDASDTYWGEALRPYCGKKPDICYCPSIPPKWRMDDNVFGWKYYWGTSIGMNVALGHDANLGAGAAFIPPCRVEDIRVPGMTIMFGDSSMYDYPNYDKKYGHWAICPPAGTTLGHLSYLNPWPSGWPYNFFDPNRHRGMVNICCADGHVVVKDRKWLIEPHADQPTKSDYTWWDKF